MSEADELRAALRELLEALDDSADASEGHDDVAAMVRYAKAEETARALVRDEAFDNPHHGHDPEWDQIEPLDRTKLPRCPKCWTNGHDHRKDCPYAGTGMAHHIKP